MRLIVPPLAASLFLLSSLVAASEDMAKELTGRYCGKLWSAGILVKVVTVLEAGPDGRLTGSYEFDDLESVTKGTLVERQGVAGPTRTFEWQDIYGTGTLAVTFDLKAGSFSGKWGALDEAPDEVWDGSKGGCEISTTSLSGAPGHPPLGLTSFSRDASPVASWSLYSANHGSLTLTGSHHSR